MSFPSLGSLALPLAICCLCVAGRGEEPRVDPASMRALFDQGGERGTGVVPGDFTVLSRLCEFPRDLVLKEAARRLKVAPQRPFDHALAVYVLRELSAPKIGETLLQAYPKLDRRGRYEVLLYAYYFRDRRFAPHFVKVLTRPHRKSIKRADLLGAGFAAIFPQQEFAPGLRRLSEQMDDFMRQLENRSSYKVTQQAELSGFPYGGGFVSFDAADPRTWVARAARHLQATSLPPSTNDAEETLLQRIRTEMLEPHRTRVELRNVPVKRLPMELQRLFTLPDGFSVHPTFNPDVDESQTELTMQHEMASLSDVIADICNQTRLTPQPGFSLNHGFAGFGERRYAAAAGFVVELEVRRAESKLAELLGPRLDFRVSVKSPLSWSRHDSFATFFRLTHVRMPDGTTFHEQMSGEVAMGSFSIPLSGEMVAKHGAVAAEVQGKVGVYVPTAVRHETIEFAQLKEERLDRDALFLRIKQAEVGADGLGSWSVTRGVVGEQNPRFMMGQRPRPLLFPGRLVALNEGGEAVQEQAELFFVGQGRFSGGNDLTFKKARLPSQLAWTYAPSCEFVLLPVTFTNVPLPD